MLCSFGRAPLCLSWVVVLALANVMQAGSVMADTPAASVYYTDYEAGSDDLDQLFVDHRNRDFRPTSDSPALNAGINRDVLAGIDVSSRPVATRRTSAPTNSKPTDLHRFALTLTSHANGKHRS